MVTVATNYDATNESEKKCTPIASFRNICCRNPKKKRKRKFIALAINQNSNVILSPFGKFYKINFRETKHPLKNGCISDNMNPIHKTLCACTSGLSFTKLRRKNKTFQQSPHQSVRNVGKFALIFNYTIPSIANTSYMGFSLTS